MAEAVEITQAFRVGPEYAGKSHCLLLLYLEPTVMRE